MRKITVVAIACAVLLLLICVVLLPSSRGARPAKIGVAFCGFTNDETGVRLAGVSDAGGGGLFRWPFYAIEERGQVAPLIRGSCRHFDIIID